MPSILRVPDTAAGPPGKVYIWNSYTGMTDANGDPDYASGTVIAQGDGYQLADGDNILLSVTNGAMTYQSDAYYIDWVDAASGDTIQYAVTYGIDTSGAAPVIDPNFGNDETTLEIDNSAYENFGQYYDDDNNPVYEVSNCDGAIGIRG